MLLNFGVRPVFPPSQLQLGFQYLLFIANAHTSSACLLDSRSIANFVLSVFVAASSMPDKLSHLCFYITSHFILYTCTCSAGLLDTRVALNLSQYIRDETDYVPCATALSQLASMGHRLSLTPVYGVFQVSY